MGSRAGRQPRLAALAEHRGRDGLVLSEIYPSIQGESTHVGRPCTFIRTTGCQRRCQWCDTRHAYTGGEYWPLGAVRAAVDRLGLPLVEVTGGEPLLQERVLPLMTALCDAGYLVLLETGGSIDISPVDPRVARIVDLKAPGSGEEGSNLYRNIDALTARDEVKLVLSDRADYLWAREVIAAHGLPERCTVLMSPVFGALSPAELARWILEDRLAVRMQVQMHKVIWDPKARGV